MSDFNFRPAFRLITAENIVAWSTLFVAVAVKSAEVRTRPADAIRGARVRRHGRCRIAECVKVELQRDNSIFDMEGQDVKSLTLGAFHGTDRNGRRWRYRDIIAAQMRYLREEAERDRRRAFGGEAEADDPVVGMRDPEADASVALLNGGNTVDHIVNCHVDPLADARFVECRAPEPGAPLDLSKVVIKHVTGVPVKRGRR